MARVYRYVGPQELKDAVSTAGAVPIRSIADVWDRLAEIGCETPHWTSLTVTFVVDSAGHLRIADRRSEHVACAGGGDVLSAGEMTFERDGGRLAISGVTNQSTGYCPEPDSWSAVEAVL